MGLKTDFKIIHVLRYLIVVHVLIIAYGGNVSSDSIITLGTIIVSEKIAPNNVISRH